MKRLISNLKIKCLFTFADNQINFYQYDNINEKIITKQYNLNNNKFSKTSNEYQRTEIHDIAKDFEETYEAAKQNFITLHKNDENFDIYNLDELLDKIAFC